MNHQTDSIILPAAGHPERISRIREYMQLYLVMGTMNCRQEIYPVSNLQPQDRIELAESVLRQAIAGGITIFQYREKGIFALQGEDYRELARRLQAVCVSHHIPFIINDDIELAIELNADGIHVGQKDMDAVQVRERIGADKIVGVSVHSLEEANHGIQAGADYLGIGPVYPTSSKLDAEPVRGTSVIEEVRQAGIDIPLVGIGGITLANAVPVIQAGADGIAVISAITGAYDPEDAAADLKKQITI